MSYVLNVRPPDCLARSRTAFAPVFGSSQLSETVGMLVQEQRLLEGQ